MKKNILFLCMLISVANLHAMDDQNMCSPVTSDDDDTAHTRSNFHGKMEELVDEMDDMTSEIAKLRIKAISAEQILRNLPSFASYNLVASLNVKMDSAAKAIKSAHLASELRKERYTHRQRAAYAQAVVHLIELNHEMMVLNEAVAEIERVMDGIARSAKQSTNSSATQSNVS